LVVTAIGEGSTPKEIYCSKVESCGKGKNGVFISLSRGLLAIVQGAGDMMRKQYQRK